MAHIKHKPTKLVVVGEPDLVANIAAAARHYVRGWLEALPAQDCEPEVLRTIADLMIVLKHKGFDPQKFLQELVLMFALEKEASEVKANGHVPQTQTRAYPLGTAKNPRRARRRGA